MTFTEYDLPYRTSSEGVLLAHIYQPSGPGPFPAVVGVHGGAWTAGDRLSNAAIDATLAERGILVAALDFRMPPVGIYPAGVLDVNYAIRWLKANASDFRTQPQLIGGLGTSSGGQTLLLNSLLPRDERYSSHRFPSTADSSLDASLAFVVACWPISDPLARYRMAKTRGLEKLVAAHDAYWTSEDLMAEGNPQLLLERGEPVNLPPLLVIQGTADENVTPDMAARFAQAYRTAGGAVDLEVFPGQPHAFIKDSGEPDSAAALDRIHEFIMRQSTQDDRVRNVSASAKPI